MWNLIFLFTGMIFNILLMIVFYSKEIINSEENKAFKFYLMSSVLNYIIEVTLQIGVRLNGVNNLFVDIFSRLYLISLILGYILFTNYVFLICMDRSNVDKFKKNYYLRQRILIIVFFIMSSLVSFMPIEKFYDGTKMYTYGTSIDMLKIFCIIFLTVYTVELLKNFKHLKDKIFLPIFGTILLLIISAVLQIIVDPSILIASVSGTFICYLMYFTIENPDLKLVNELYKNKSIMEQTYEDKSNFLFELTQTIKEPLSNINNICTELKDSKKQADIKSGLEHIRYYAKELDFALNDILDVSNMSNNVVKFIENKYNVERLFDEIVNRISSTLPSSVKFTSSITHNIPTLYGDSIKLKQIMMSLLQNSVKHTNKGFIDFSVSTIERFDAIRLIITIKDSSDGLSIDKINEILTMTGSLDTLEIEALEKSDLNLKICQKMVKMLGGNMLIKSDNGKGTEITLIIDQKIADHNQQKIDSYESVVKTFTNVMVVSQDKKIIETLKDVFKAHNINGLYSVDGSSIVDKVKSGKKYDYILVSDEMNGMNGIEILNELKKIKGFKIPVIIIIDENKEKLAKHFLEEGFANYILTSNFEEDLNTIINKY